MANGSAKANMIRRIFGKASPLVKTVIAAAIVLFTVSLVTIRIVQWDTQEAAQNLQQQAAALELENARLQEQIDELGTMGSIRRIASQELGLVDPNAIIIDSE